MKPITLLQAFLNEKFPVSGTWTKEELQTAFTDQFGVDVKLEAHTHGKNLYMFKYDMLAAKWLQPLTHECRGMILRNSNEGWEIMSHPFNKFFNQAEGHCSISKPEAFAAACDDLSFTSKADGSLIHVWFDKYKIQWRVSTSGSITSSPIHDTGVTFETLFWNLAGNDFTLGMDQKRTHMFELCSTINRVVTRYPSDRIYLLGIRDNETGKLLPYSECETLFLRQLSQEKTNLMTLFKQDFKSLGIKSINDAENWVESQSKNKEQYGEYSEGFVVYNSDGPLCKMKNSNYLALHHSLSDSACTRNAVITSFFKGTMDDLYPVLPEPFQKFADKLKVWLEQIVIDFNNEVDPQIKSTTFPTRKDYALFVNGLAPKYKQFRSFFFCDQEGVCSSANKVGNLFAKWICDNHEKFEDYFKTMA